MIISHKYKFIFIKTKKTSGSSIEIFLSQFCGEDDALSVINPEVYPHFPKNYRGFFNPIADIIEMRGDGYRKVLRKFVKREKYYSHIPARVVRRRLPDEVWNEYFKFCVERNPWDKTLSYHHWYNFKHGTQRTLDEYINEGNFCINYPLYTDENGKIIVDRVIRYESLLPELGEVFAMLGIPFSGTLGVSAKGDARKDKRPYQEVYSERQRAAVEKAFAEEIKMHGYTFEEPIANIAASSMGMDSLSRS